MGSPFFFFFFLFLSVFRLGVLGYGMYYCSFFGVIRFDIPVCLRSRVCTVMHGLMLMRHEVMNRMAYLLYEVYGVGY